MIYIIFRYVLTTDKSSKMHKNRHLQFTNAHRLRQELKAIASTINPTGWTNASKARATGTGPRARLIIHNAAD